MLYFLRLKMLEVINHAKSIRVKYVFLFLFVIWFVVWIFTFFFADKYHFHNISERSVEIQKKCLDDFLTVFHKHKIPVILFDIVILSELFQARPSSWHQSQHKCKSLCKYHPQGKSAISFAVKGSKFFGKDDLIVNDLQRMGYAVHLSLDVDPRLRAIDGTMMYLPTFLWIAKHDHLIHIAFLHERLGSYFWIGPVKDADWKETVTALSPALSDGWHSMEKVGVKFPTYAQAFDNSQNFLGMSVEIDGLKVNVPYFIKKFLMEYKNSHFIECHQERAMNFKLQYETDLTASDEAFKRNAKQLILRAKAVLDGINVPFWLSSGTCLGWYRQCDIIPYSVDVDFGIFIEDYSMKIIESMHENGILLIHKFGKLNDSLELSFIGEEKIKLDIFFFYREDGYIWNGGTRVHDGEKYKYRFSTFNLCWTEFLQMKLRVPCNPLVYIEANYGKDWMIPKRNWQWNSDPPNLEVNGKWKDAEQDLVVQSFEIVETHRNAP